MVLIDGLYPALFAILHSFPRELGLNLCFLRYHEGFRPREFMLVLGHSRGFALLSV